MAKQKLPAIHQVVSRLSAKRGIDRALAEARSQLAPADYPALLGRLLSKEDVARTVFSGRLRNNHLFLYRYSPPMPLKLKREIAWAAAYLDRHVDLLSDFSTFRTQFDVAFLNGNWTDAHQILDSIDTTLGVSFWSHNARIGLLQTAEGLDSQKQYVERIRQDASPTSVFSYLVQRASVRNEPAVSKTRFVQLVEKHLADVGVSSDLLPLLRYHLMPTRSFSSDDLCVILASNVRGSLPDYYEAFVAAVRRILADDHEELGELADVQARHFGERCNDERLLNSSCRAGVTSQISVDPATSDLAKLLRSKSGFSMNLQHSQQPTAQAMLLSAISMAKSKQRSAEEVNPPDRSLPPIESFILRLTSLLEDAGSDRHNIDELAKTSWNFPGSSWAEALDLIATRESSSDPLAPTNLETTIAVSGQPLLQPILARYSADQRWLTETAARSAESTILDPIAQAFVQSYATREQKLPVEVSADWIALVDAEIAYGSNLFDHVIKKTQPLVNDHSAFIRNAAYRLHVNALVRNGQAAAAVRFAVRAIVLDQRPATLFPLGLIASVLTGAAREELVRDLELPIFYDLAAKHAGPEERPDRAFASEDFLAAQGLERPSSLQAKATEFESGLLIYYLSFVCVESVLDVSIVYEGSRDLATERLEVCKLLLQLDPGNGDVYEEEVRGIQRRLLIAERSREVEQSRVYVDLDGIRRISQSRWGASFQRYRSLITLRTEPADAGSILKAIEESITQNPAKARNHLQLPKDEATAVLVELLNDIRDVFATSAEFGLDGYLSVRIRHGTLSGYLRRPLEAHSVITRKSAESGLYQDDDHWAQRLGLPEPQADTLGRRIALFSEEFDSLVEEIASGWIRVRSRAHPNGMFDFDLPLEWAALVTGVIENEPTFPEFINTVLGLHIRQLELQLAQVRERIGDEAKASAAAILTHFQEDVEAICGQTARPLHDAINASRTDLQTALDRVVEWFRLPPVTESIPVSAHDAADVALASIRTIHPEFQVTIETAIPDLLIEMRGTQFQNLVYVFFTLFKNVIERSATSGEEATLEIWSASVEESTKLELHFLLSNSVAPQVRSALNVARLEKIRSDIREGRFQGSVALEGGTGLHKVYNLLVTDFTRDPKFEFGFGDDNTFDVEFALQFTPTA